MSYNREVAIAKIRNCVNNGNDPFYMVDWQVSEFKNSSSTDYQNEVAKAYIQAEINEGKDPYYSKNPAILNYYDRCNEAKISPTISNSSAVSNNAELSGIVNQAIISGNLDEMKRIKSIILSNSNYNSNQMLKNIVNNLNSAINNSSTTLSETEKLIKYWSSPEGAAQHAKNMADAPRRLALAKKAGEDLDRRLTAEYRNNFVKKCRAMKPFSTFEEEQKFRQTISNNEYWLYKKVKERNGFEKFIDELFPNLNLPGKGY
jgi:hypothetical protein